MLLVVEVDGLLELAQLFERVLVAPLVLLGAHRRAVLRLEELELVGRGTDPLAKDNLEMSKNHMLYKYIVYL